MLAVSESRQLLTGLTETGTLLTKLGAIGTAAGPITAGKGIGPMIGAGAITGGTGSIPAIGGGITRGIAAIAPIIRIAGLTIGTGKVEGRGTKDAAIASLSQQSSNCKGL